MSMTTSSPTATGILDKAVFTRYTTDLQRPLYPRQVIIADDRRNLSQNLLSEAPKVPKVLNRLYQHAKVC
jgi:hypothetical protein